MSWRPLIAVVLVYGVAGCTASSHGESCSARSYAECACPFGYVGTMGCIDGVYGECRCPTDCAVADSAPRPCECVVPGLPTEGGRVCEGVWGRCSCEAEPTPCSAGQRARCACRMGGTAEAVCGADGVWEECGCSTDGGVPEVPDGCTPITCEAQGVSCGPAPNGCGGTTDCGPCAVELTTLALSANEMVWSAPLDVLLVAAAIRVGEVGSVVRAVDPTTLATVFEVPVEGDPQHLALAGDGRTLWVSIETEIRHELRRIDLESRTVGTPIRLPFTAFGEPLQVRDLVVLPGSESTVVVAVTDDVFDERLMAYEDGVLGAELGDLRDHPGETLMGVDSTTLVTYSHGYLTAYRLSGSEIRATRTLDEFLPDGQVTYESERVFSERGWVVDVHTFAELGSVSVEGTCVAEPPSVPGSTAARVYYLDRSLGDGMSLVVAEPAEGRIVSTQPLAVPPMLSTRSLVRWGDRGLAFLGTTATAREAVPDTLFVVTSDAVGGGS